MVFTLLMCFMVKAEKFQLRNKFEEISVYGITSGESFFKCVSVSENVLWDLTEYKESLPAIQKVYKAMRLGTKDKLSA